MKRFAALAMLALALLAPLAPVPASAFFYPTTLKNTRMDAITTAIGTSGLLKLYTAGGGATACSGTVLATLSLSATAAPASSGGVLTFNAIASASAAATGTAVCAQFTTSASVAVVDGLTVGTSGANLNLNSTAISSGQTVSVTSASLTHG